MAQDLCKTYTDDALKAIGELEDCDAKDILIKMVSYLKTWSIYDLQLWDYYEVKLLNSMLNVFHCYDIKETFNNCHILHA